MLFPKICGAIIYGGLALLVTNAFFAVVHGPVNKPRPWVEYLISVLVGIAMFFVVLLTSP